MKIKINITIDPDVHEGLIKVAENERRSLSNLINKVLTEYLQSISKDH